MGTVRWTYSSFPVVQDERDLFDAAERGCVSAVRRLIAADVNVDCTPYQVATICKSIHCTSISIDYEQHVIKLSLYRVAGLH